MDDRLSLVMASLVLFALSIYILRHIVVHKMFKRIFRQGEEISRPRHGVSKSRPRQRGGQIPQQFMQQINDNEFDMILFPQHPPRPAKKSVQAPQQDLGFVFHPMATSTPRRKNKTSDPSIASTMPELMDEPEPCSQENHRLGARLTMSQFIGTLPSKKQKTLDRTTSPSSQRDVTLDADEIAVKLPKFIHNDSNDFETIFVDDFTDGDSHAPGVDLNKTEDIVNIIYGDDYNTTDDLEPAFDFLNDQRKAVPDNPFAINDSTRLIFKDMFRDTNAREEGRVFKKPNLLPQREFYKTTRHTSEPDFLLEQPKPQPKRKKALDGLQLRTELRKLYEFLKLLFADNEGEDCNRGIR